MASGRGTMTAGSNLATKRASGCLGSEMPFESIFMAPFVGDSGERNVGGGSCQSIGELSIDSTSFSVGAAFSTASETHASETLIGG